ncbi:MAG: molybdopterin-dependent oxidoreductase [Gemmatimonadaceae bacterium]|nr:molybdopterin-dependent oxidoreductase [Gemmatimonadaceae bacterium]
MPRRLLLASLMLTLSAPVSAQPSSALVVKHPDGSETTLTTLSLAQLPRLTGRATAHGKSWSWEGVDLREVLRAAGVTPVDSLRGPQLRRVIMLVGADGYRAAIALSEIDPTIGGRRAIVVDREDGAALPQAEGPRRIIIEADVRPTRWVRQLIRIDVVDLP